MLTSTVTTIVIFWDNKRPYAIKVSKAFSCESTPLAAIIATVLVSCTACELYYLRAVLPVSCTACELHCL